MEAWLAVVERDPRFAPGRGRLFAPWNIPPSQHESYYLRALQFDPRSSDLHRAYLLFLKRTKQEAKFRMHRQAAAHWLNPNLRQPAPEE